MNGRDAQQLKKPRQLIDERRDRLVKFAGLIKDNPGLEFLVLEAAALYLSSFKWSWRVWWDNAKVHTPPRWQWLAKLVDRDYAALCRQVDAAEVDTDKDATK